MAISPPSDIIMDVMRAADPERMRRAAAALRKGRPVRAAGLPEAFSPEKADTGTFAARLASAERAPARAAASRTAAGVRFPPSSGAGEGPVNLLAGLDVPPPARTAVKNAPAAIRPVETGARSAPEKALPREDAMRRAYAGLEGLLVRQMLEGALAGGDAGSGSFFGGGLAGSYWRSMMAASIADALAAAGGLGMAARLAVRLPQAGPTGI